jgi:hypothetical protein
MKKSITKTKLAEAPTMYETENDILLKNRLELNALMNQRLASAVDLQSQMKQTHWNVKGPSFIGRTNCSTKWTKPSRTMWT